MRKKIYFLVLASLLFACNKPGPGGSAAIEGLVTHNGTAVPGVVVYIKYGAKSFPGANITYYNANVTADKSGHYEFLNFNDGYYYLFAVGFDTLIGNTVNGNAPAVLKTKTQTLEADIPVSQ